MTSEYISAGTKSAKSHNLVFLSAAKEPWGAEKSLSILLRQLRSRGVRTHAITMSKKTSEFLSDFTTTSIAPKSKYGRILDLVSMLRKIRDSERGTVLVIFSLQLLPLIPVLRVLYPGRYRLVADLHDAPQGVLDRIASAICVKFAHETISISKYVANHLWTGAGSAIVPRPIEPSLSHQDPAVLAGTKSSDDTESKPVTVGVVGRIDREKRIDLVVRAVGRLQHDMQIKLNVYGDTHLNGDYPAELVSLAGVYGGAFLNFRGVQKPGLIYSEIDVLVVANDNEPSGRTVGEAMMHRIPVVTPDKGGAREFFEPEESGVIFESGDSDSLANALVRVLGDVSLRQRVTSAGYERINQERNPDRIGEEYLSTLRRAALIA